MIWSFLLFGSRWASRIFPIGHLLFLRLLARPIEPLRRRHFRDFSVRFRRGLLLVRHVSDFLLSDAAEDAPPPTPEPAYLFGSARPLLRRPFLCPPRLSRNSELLEYWC